MDVLVHLLDVIRIDFFFHVLSKVRFIFLGIFLDQISHVFSHMLSKYAILVCISIILFGVFVVSWKSLLAMRNIQTSIYRPLKCTEYTSSSTSCRDSNIKDASEWILVIIQLFNIVCTLSIGATFAADSLSGILKFFVIILILIV